MKRGVYVSPVGYLAEIKTNMFGNIELYMENDWDYVEFTGPIRYLLSGFEYLGKL